jgi:hypothetical protein
MGYLVTISYLKMVTEWDPEQGATGNPRKVDEQRTSKFFNHKPAKIDISRLVNKKFRPTFSNAIHDPEVDGRFNISRVEDDDGSEDPNGKWLADYDLQITIEKTSPVKVGPLNTNSF